MSPLSQAEGDKSKLRMSYWQPLILLTERTIIDIGYFNCRS